jgi:hypothetical protein
MLEIFGQDLQVRVQVGRSEVLRRESFLPAEHVQFEVGTAAGL